MGHPDEGRIRTFLDGEAGSESSGIQAHLQTCSRCAALAEKQEEAMAILAQGLSLGDVPPVPEQVFRRVLRHRGGSPASRPLLRRHLLKAASIAVLLTAGAAAAFPGSPLREWLFRDGGSGLEEETAEGPGTLPPAGQREGIGEMVGASMPVKSGGMTIRILEMGEGTEVRVRLVEGDRAGVFAGEGTRFRTEETVMEARGAPGPLTVEVPRGASRVEVLVGGDLIFRQMGGVVETPGPVIHRTDQEILFRLPGEAH